MSPQPDLKWIRSQLETLYTRADEIADQAESTNNLRPWSGLKLITLAYIVDVYTTIISNRFDDWYYIDALAGSGALESDEFDTQFVGSPILAASVAAEPFTKMYFIEEDPERVQALRTRLDYVADEIDEIELDRDSCKVLKRDTNEVLPKLPQWIKTSRGSLRGAHHFTFVDNERADVYWDAIAGLSQMWGDFLINYQPMGINRDRGNGRLDKLDAFYGTDEHRTKRSDEARRKLYLRKFDSIDRENRRLIRVDGSKDHRYHYDLIYAARETDGTNDWFEAIDSIKRNVESLDGDDIARVLAVLRGRSVMSGDTEQSGLDQFR